MLGYLCNANICAERNSRLHATTWIGLHQLEPPTRADCLFSINIAGPVVRATQFTAPGPAIHNYSPALCICTYIYFRDHFIGLHFAAIPGVFSDPEFRHRVTLEWALALCNPTKPLLCCSDCLFFSRFH